MTATPNGPRTRSWIDPAIRQDDVAHGGVVVTELLRRGAQEPRLRSGGQGAEDPAHPPGADEREGRRRDEGDAPDEPAHRHLDERGPQRGRREGGDHRGRERQPGEEQAAAPGGPPRRARRRRPPRSADGGTWTGDDAARAGSSRARPGKEMTSSGQDPAPSGPSRRSPPELEITPCGANGQRPCAGSAVERSERWETRTIATAPIARQGRLSTGAHARCGGNHSRVDRASNPAAASRGDSPGRSMGGDPARARDGGPGARGRRPDPARRGRRLAADRDAVHDDHLRGPCTTTTKARRPIT